MRKLKLLLTLLLSTYLFVDSLAQVMPFVYDVENTGVDCPIPYLPSFSELPTINSLPDPFAWADGRGRISNFSDWRYRRAEISAEVINYELGTKPPPLPPDSLEASFANNTLTVTVTVGGNSLTLTANINRPQGTGPFPAVIGVGSPTGSLPSNIFTSRGVATIQFNYGQIAPNTQSGRGLGGFYTLYPDTRVGYFSAWTWGISRIIDGLEKVPEANIDTRHLAVTGCSFAGKIALFAGAFDERIALTIPEEPGGGGDATWRVSQTLTGSVETLSRAQGYGWYYEDVRLFNDAVTKLPFDHHEVMAMIAPRALFVLGNPSVEWLADESGYVGCKAAKEVWNALGVPDRFGFSKVGGHNHCQFPDSQRTEVEAFVEKFLLGNTAANTNISTNPGYTTNLAQWITWTTPALSNDTSFWGRASLIYPSNLQEGLDTSITFIWNKVNNAEKYFFQLSFNPTFTNIVKSDSTTDTLTTINNLLSGKRYFWRIQAKSIDGSGPWSEVWNFATAIPLPAMAPQLVSAAPYPTRPGWFTFTWNKVNYAEQYSIQLSENETFTNVLQSASTSDTVKTLSGLLETQRYYWRVQASNIAGSSPWSDVWTFSTLLAPTNLVLERSALNEITLTWNDNSTDEDGYIIERKQSPQTSFTVLDSLEESVEEYVDNEVEQAQTYTYRIKGYKDSVESDYSNEASLILTDVIVEEGIPTEYSLSQNYPNPFNPTTKIKFSLPQSVLTRLTIYDLLGREVQTLINNELEAGYHEINFDASNFPSGVYLCKMQAGNFSNTIKLLLIK